MYNKNSLDTIAASLAYAIRVESPMKSAPANEELVKYIDKAFGEEGADRVFMYNPDAVAEWIYRKYPYLTKEVSEICDIEVPLATVMPSVTPVCFGTMYTGAQPAVHGIQRYEKPVIRIDTIFDALIRAGKKVAIVADCECSVGKIFLERKMDYFLYPTIQEINAKLAELIIQDKYDFIVAYNGNYDTRMHKTGTESIESLSELRANSYAFAMFAEMIQTHWKKHNTLMGFAMDHGCHDIDGNAGSHGLDMEEDINIVHLYKAYPKKSN
jgi:predicted AlkP superfamily pyrophosphatase or phosphodiesterase